MSKEDYRSGSKFDIELEGTTTLYPHHSKKYAMTYCTTKPIIFSSIHGRKLVAKFNIGHINSDAKLFMLHKSDNQIGLID